MHRPPEYPRADAVHQRVRVPPESERCGLIRGSHPSGAGTVVGTIGKTVGRAEIGRTELACTAFSIVAIGILLLGGCAQREMSRPSIGNQDALARLQVGMTPKEVAGLMQRKPCDMEYYRGKNGEPVFVDKYLTHPPPPSLWSHPVVRSVVEADLTPLVFVNDILEGWGWSYMETASIRYEFVIKFNTRLLCPQ